MAKTVLLACALACALFAPLPASAQTDVCKQDLLDQSACDRAKAYYKSANDRATRQRERHAALQGQRETVQALQAALGRVPQAIASIERALQNAVEATRQSRAALQKTARACQGTLSLTRTLLADASAFRAAARNFATTETANAEAAARAADGTLDATREDERKIALSQSDCEKAMTESRDRVGTQAWATREYKDSLGQAAHLADQISSTSDALAKASEKQKTKSADAISTLTKSASRLGQALHDWAGAASAIGVASVAAATEKPLAGNKFETGPLVALASEKIIADDAMVFTDITSAARVRWCGGDARCIDSGRMAVRESIEQASRAGAALERSQQAADAFLGQLAVAARAADASDPVFSRVAEALKTAPLAMEGGPVLDRLVAALEAEEKDELALLEKFTAEADRAYFDAYGKLYDRVSVPKMAPSPAPVPVGAAAPRPAIAKDHAYEFISTDVRESPGFAAYTYVYVGHKAPKQVSDVLAERYLKTLISVVSTTTVAVDIPAGNRKEFNVFCVPNVNAIKRNRTQEPLRPDEWLITEYDHRLVAHLLLTTHAGAVLREIVRSNGGFGPYFLTTFKPIKETRSGDRLIFVDLSDWPPGYVPDLVESYKKRFSQPPPAEEREQWKPSVAARIVMNLDQLGGMLKRLKGEDTWGVGNAFAGESKQKFVQLKR